jgi:hypothetical protein
MFTTFQTFDSERTCCRLFQKRVMLTTFQLLFDFERKVWKVVGMTRFWNNLQHVRSKSKVWKVVSMTCFWNNLQHVRSKSKVWKVVSRFWEYVLQVIPETRRVHYFPNLWFWAYLLQVILETRHAHYFPNLWFWAYMRKVIPETRHAHYFPTFDFERTCCRLFLKRVMLLMYSQNQRFGK